MKQPTRLEMIVDGNRYKVAVTVSNTVHIWNATTYRHIGMKNLHENPEILYALEILLTANGFVVYEDETTIKATKEVKNL